MVIAEKVAEKVEQKFSYWDELIKSGDVTQEQADRLIALTQENRLTFDGHRTEVDEKHGTYSIICEIFYDHPYEIEAPKPLTTRRASVSQVILTFNPKLKKQFEPVEVPQLEGFIVPSAIIDFLIDGLKLTPNHWNAHSMALFQTSYRQFTPREEYNIYYYGNPEGLRR